MKKIKLVLPVIVAGSAALPLMMITSCNNANDLLVRGGSTELTAHYDEFGWDVNTWKTTLKGEFIYPTYSIVNLSNKKVNLTVDSGVVYWTNPTHAYETVTFNVQAKYGQHFGLSPKITLTVLATKDDDFEWTETDSGYTVNKYIGTNKNVYVPKEHLAKPVDCIGVRAFNNNPTLENIYIPKEIKIIDSEAFDGCQTLKKVNFEEGSKLQTLKGGCFNYTGLEEINLENCHNLEKMEHNCLRRTHLKQLYLPESLNNFVECLYGNLDLESIIISKQNKRYKDFDSNCVVDIKDNVNILISGCTNTVISNKVKRIGSYSFNYRWNEKEYFPIPEGVLYISEDAFWNANIANITLPSTLVSIGKHAFIAPCIKSITFAGTVNQWNKIVEEQPEWYYDSMNPEMKVMCSDGWVWAVPR